MKKSFLLDRLGLLIIVSLVLPISHSKADAVTDWNKWAGDIVVDAEIGPLPAERALAIVQTAVYESVNAITRRYSTSNIELLTPKPDASIEAAIAEANRVTLIQLVPNQQASIEKTYQAAISAISDGLAKRAGIELGAKVAQTILAKRAKDGAANKESYRPNTSAGVYIPTVIPEASQWVKRIPWLMTNPAQFRPMPPPELGSDTWARDYNEVKAFGRFDSQVRTSEQTEIARFWEEVMPPIYHGVIRAVATQPGREITQNARLFAAITQASDDALIAVFDAKYHYGFWRPLTAIRNGDIDGNEATERDSTWLPFIGTPMHPEYPCAHCIVSATVGTVLEAEIGDAPSPMLTTVSRAANNATRSWRNVHDFMQEVVNARIYDGVHYRSSGEVGSNMGQQIAQLAIKKYKIGEK